MHLHLPKPLHGWREFAGEVGIIVIGVLIALSAEQVLQNWHWRGEVRETDSRMTKDMRYDLAVAYERSAIDSCLRPRLSELRDELLKHDPNWPGRPSPLFQRPLQIKFPERVSDSRPTLDRGSMANSAEWGSARSLPAGSRAVVRDFVQ
jgi:hypothetical protein